MKRRKALVLTASVIGTTIIGSEFFLMGCSNDRRSVILFSDQDIKLLDEVGEVILPRTQLSPGAKDANIGLFMKTIVTDCYSENEQNIFRNGITDLNNISQNRYSSKFLELGKEQKHELLENIDKETRKVANEVTPHFFSMMKQLTIWGYFTSEPGTTKALKYNQIPGDYIGCIPYNKGDKAWA